MSVYIAAFRMNNGISEAKVVADIYNEDWLLVGERCYGWHPEREVTWNGIDVDEDWLAKHREHYEK